MAPKSLLALLISAPALGVLGESSGTVLRKVNASGFVFDCRFAGEDGQQGDVMMLHGFPEWSSMYDSLMEQLASKGYRSVACDQRGYSPGASPESEEDYNYDKLRDDVWNVADAVGFQNFHLVAHDHGAVLGWYTAGSSLGQQRIRSYAAMSIPHNEAFSAGLLGPTADIHQQMASQYFSVFTLKDSAYLDLHMLSNTMGLASGFHSAEAFQKAIWWYNGAMDVGVISLPPLFSASDLLFHGYGAMAAMRKAFGMNADIPNHDLPQRAPAGPMKMPTLYICGESDPTILCSRPYALKTKDYCHNGYQYMGVALCAHSVLGCHGVEDRIVEHILAVTDRSNATAIIV